jgi:hypothetical protein
LSDILHDDLHRVPAAQPEEAALPSQKKFLIKGKIDVSNSSADLFYKNTVSVGIYAKIFPKNPQKPVSGCLKKDGPLIMGFPLWEGEHSKEFLIGETKVTIGENYILNASFDESKLPAKCGYDVSYRLAITRFQNNEDKRDLFFDIKFVNQSESDILGGFREVVGSTLLGKEEFQNMENIYCVDTVSSKWGYRAIMGCLPKSSKGEVIPFNVFFYKKRNQWRQKIGITQDFIIPKGEVFKLSPDKQTAIINKTINYTIEHFESATDKELDKYNDRVIEPKLAGNLAHCLATDPVSAKSGFKCQTSEDFTFTRVTDKEFGNAWKDPSGLIWSDESHITFRRKTFLEATDECDRMGGRLPTINELFSTMDENGGREVLPFYDNNSALWSSTHDVRDIENPKSRLVIESFESPLRSKGSQDPEAKMSFRCVRR